MRSSTIRDAEREVARAEAQVAAEQAHVDQLRERLAPVVEHAIRVAREQAALAAVAAGTAAGSARERVLPAMDAARDRIVEDLLPRLVDAVHHAGVAGAAARSAAAETMSRTVEDAARHLAASTPRAKARARRRRRQARTTWIALAGALLAAIAAVVVRKARARQAEWELAPTGVPATSAELPGDSAMDVIAAAVGPSDAGVAPGSQTPEPAAEPSTGPVGETVTAGPSVVSEPVEPVEPVAPVDAVEPMKPSGPETVGIETGPIDAPTAPRSRHS